jgi:hypothetical protein
MPESPITRITSLVGTVVESFAREGEEVVTIALRPIHIEVPKAYFDDPHLGDSVQLECHLSLGKIRPLTFDEDPEAIDISPL